MMLKNIFKSDILFFSRSTLRNNKQLLDFHYFVAEEVLHGSSVIVIWYGGWVYRILQKLRLDGMCLRTMKLIFRPKLALFMDESSSRKLAPQVKKLLAVKTANLSHALVSYHKFYRDIDFDYYFVYGNKCRFSCERFNIKLNHTRLVPIGPFYSACKMLMKGNSFRDSLEVALSRNNEYSVRICITSQWLDLNASKSLLFDSYCKLLEYIELNSDILFYIKPHPLERDTNSPLSRAYSLNNAIALSKESSISDLSDVVDLNVCSFSNSVIDFAMLGVPSLFLRFRSEVLDNYGVVPNDYSLVVDDMKAFDYIVRNRRFSKADAQKIIDHNTDGRGFDSILNFQKQINKIINESQF